MKKILIISLIVILSFSLISCATWKSNITTGYEATGMTLKEIHDTAKAMCAAGTLSAADCAQVKDIYDKARDAYITAGDALIVAINTEDAVTKENNLQAYQHAISDVSQLVPKLIKLAGQLGIKTGGE